MSEFYLTAEELPHVLQACERFRGKDGCWWGITRQGKQVDYWSRTLRTACVLQYG